MSSSRTHPVGRRLWWSRSCWYRLPGAMGCSFGWRLAFFFLSISCISNPVRGRTEVPPTTLLNFLCATARGFVATRIRRASAVLALSACRLRAPLLPLLCGSRDFQPTSAPAGFGAIHMVRRNIITVNTTSEHWRKTYGKMPVLQEACYPERENRILAGFPAGPQRSGRICEEGNHVFLSAL